MERGPSPKILRLAPDSEFVSLLCLYFTLAVFHFSPSPSFSIAAFEILFAHRSQTLEALSALIIPGGFFNRSLFIRASCPTHVSHFRMYLLFTIVCINMTKVLAKLGCLASVLTPTFPIVRLGGKGSTSAIVTAGSAGCVPQTG